ncbi:transposase [Streptomyces prunicolor]
MRSRPDVVLADKAYSSRAIHDHLRKRGIRTVIQVPAGHRPATARPTSSATPSSGASTASSTGEVWPPATRRPRPSTRPDFTSSESSPGANLFLIAAVRFSSAGSAISSSFGG